MNWRHWTGLATIAWTLWGISVKFALKKVDWARLDILSAVAALAIVAVVAPAAYRGRFSEGDLTALLAGTFGALGGVFFYIAVERGPVSVIIPITSLYVVGVAVGGMLLLGEPFSWRKVAGVTCAAAAILLLASED